MLFNNFIDKITLTCISGNGGHGCVHFIKKNKKLGKPDGGNGGDGGKIIFVGDKNLFTLYSFKNKRIYKAQNGFNGMKNCKTGKNGKNIIIKIPLYTILSYKKRETKKKIIIKKQDEKKILILGGKGGKGNNFYKNSSNQKSKNYSLGEKGKKLIIKLKLQLKIDIGIIGYPNTGKSTILSILTSNKPRIADYDYTTIIPNIGIYYKNYNKYIVMDIPAIYLKNGKIIKNKYLKYLKDCNIILIIMSINNIKEYKKNNLIIKRILNKNKINIKNKIIIISKYYNIKKKNLVLLKKYFKKKKKNIFFFNKKDKEKKELKKQINKIL